MLLTKLRNALTRIYKPLFCQSQILVRNGLKWGIGLNFKVEEAIEVLERTPDTLAHYLSGLSEGWLHFDEGKVHGML